jgi:hypothetical protein
MPQKSEEQTFHNAFGAVQGYGFNVQRPIPTLNPFDKLRACFEH